MTHSASSIGQQAMVQTPAEIELRRIPTETRAESPQPRPLTSSEHIVPEGLSRRPSFGSAREGGEAAGEAPSRPGSAGGSPPRRSAPPSRTPSTASRASRDASNPALAELPVLPAPVATGSHDAISDLTRRMPGAFDPLPPIPPPPVNQIPRAEPGLASLHAPTVPGFREVNPRVNLGELSERLPDDVKGCVAFMLSSMRQSPADIPALEQLATQQAQVLTERGIHTRDDFIGLLQQVQWRDTGTGIMHGMASANGFNVGSALVNFKLADLSLGGLAKALPELPAMLPGLVAGAALGFGLSVMDVAAGASAGKTFKDAYFTRPPEDRLPAPLYGANAHTKTSMALDSTIAAGASYGAARNGAIRIPMMLGLEGTGQPLKRALADNIADPLGGSIIGGGGMRLVRNDRDTGAGRAGFQHFLARTDLAECVDHLQKPALEQIESGLKRGVAYVKNVGTTLPSAIEDAFASKVGWTSHAILTPGFGGLFAMLTTMPGQLKDKGWSEKEANIATQISKFAVLQVLYHLWGGALGAVAGPKAQAEQPGNAV